jgi:hypothetical protein
MEVIREPGQLTTLEASREIERHSLFRVAAEPSGF